VLECDRNASDCFNATDWQSFPPANPGGDLFNQVCTDGSRFYVTGMNSLTQATLYARRGSVYTSVASYSTNAGMLQGCWVLTDGTVVATGNGSITRYFADGGSDELPVAAPGFNGTFSRWRAVEQVGGRIFIAGDSRQIVELLPDAGFLLHMHPVGTQPKLTTLAGVFVDEVYAAGDDSASSPLSRFNGMGWSNAPGILPLLDVSDLFALDANTWYAAGTLRNSSGGIVGGRIMFGLR
jgi:hypothetical protein